ncbi:MAG: hypothetical protein MK098_10935 [Marinovum sp.]|nr:hypothetical protein [Marinovum sp.]
MTTTGALAFVLTATVLLALFENHAVPERVFSWNKTHEPQAIRARLSQVSDLQDQGYTDAGDCGMFGCLWFEPLIVCDFDDESGFCGVTRGRSDTFVYASWSTEAQPQISVETRSRQWLGSPPVIHRDVLRAMGDVQ